MIKNESEAETIIRELTTLKLLNGHEVNREALYEDEQNHFNSQENMLPVYQPLKQSKVHNNNSPLYETMEI